MSTSPELPNPSSYNAMFAPEVLSSHFPPSNPLSAFMLQAIEIILCEAQNDICYTAIASLERAMREAEASKQPLVKLPI